MATLGTLTTRARITIFVVKIVMAATAVAPIKFIRIKARINSSFSQD